MRHATALVLLAASAISACGGRVAGVADASNEPVSPADAGMTVPIPEPIDATVPPSTLDASFPPPPSFDGDVPPSFDSDLPPSEDADICEAPDGGERCDPGYVFCGATTCPVPMNRCCISQNGTPSCEPSAIACQGLALACDEASDCPGGEVCCLVATSASVTGVSTSCEASCQGGLIAVQICKSDTECPDGQCIPQSCMLGGAGLSVEACSLIPTCTAQ